MTFYDPTLYGRDEEEEFGDSGAYSESLEEDFEDEIEERLERQTDEGAQELKTTSREVVLTGGVWPDDEIGDTMIINMGPQHPSTHGVLRLMMELDAEEVVALTLAEIHAWVHVGDRPNGRIGRGDFADHPQPSIPRVRQEVRDDFVPFGDDTVGAIPNSVEQVVDRRDVEAHREMLFVAQEHRDVVPLFTRDVHDGLPVALVEQRARELPDDGGRDFVGRQLGR